MSLRVCREPLTFLQAAWRHSGAFHQFRLGWVSLRLRLDPRDDLYSEPDTNYRSKENTPVGGQLVERNSNSSNEVVRQSGWVNGAQRVWRSFLTVPKTEKPVKTKLMSCSFVQMSLTPSTWRSTLVGSVAIANKRIQLILYCIITIWRGAACRKKRGLTKTPTKRRLDLQNKVSLRERQLISRHYHWEQAKRLNRCSSYLVIERYHEVAVDWSAVRLVLQGTLFCVQFDLVMLKETERKLAGNNEARLVSNNANGIFSASARFSVKISQPISPPTNPMDTVNEQTRIKI